MKLTNLISAFHKRPDHDAAVAQRAAIQSGLHSRNNTDRIPEPAHLRHDRVGLNSAASYAIVAKKFDPYRLSPRGLAELTDELRDGDAIGPSEQSILLQGPDGKGYYGENYDQPRNIIGDWQERLARALGKSDLVGIERATRALDVLGRVSSSRVLI